jgi:hypothetical protein
MPAEGIFHDAHEVYARPNKAVPWIWLATFSSKALAENYTKSGAIPLEAQIEVRPV